VDEIVIDKRQQVMISHAISSTNSFAQLIWLMANIGGVLGLTCGCSLVTIAEVIFFVAKWRLYVQNRRKTV